MLTPLLALLLARQGFAVLIHGAATESSRVTSAEVLAALGCVDYVVIFPELTVTNLFLAVRPQIYAKGGDYTPETLVREEREVIEKAGSQIRILPLVPGHSTTNTIAAALCKH